jgi:CheY-like chemotaxis protein/HPt (histidine-containing phosphotransfer) domain-containing protein
MNGDIGVESEVGKGSTFYFTITLEVGDSALAAKTKKVSDLSIAGSLQTLNARILLVDDNATNRKVAGQILLKAGCEVRMSSSGREAISIVQADANFDLVLMDIQMPELDGMETTRRLKALNLPNLPPIVAMTAYAMKEDRERFLAAGMDDYLAKPIRAQQLIQTVSRWVSTGHASLQAEVIPTNFVVDEEVLASLSDAVGGDPAFVQSMLEEFIAEAKEQIAASILFHSQSNCKGVQAELHTLKGNSGTLGAAQVHELCEKIEIKAKVCDFKHFAKEIVDLQIALKNFQDAIEAKFA